MQKKGLFYKLIKKAKKFFKNKCDYFFFSSISILALNITILIIIYIIINSTSVLLKCHSARRGLSTRSLSI